MNYEEAKQQEAALIGSVLKNPDQFQTLQDVVTQEMFYDIGFKACWKAFGSLTESGLHIDTVTVGDELARSVALQDVAFSNWQGRPAVAALREEGRPQNASSYAFNVQDYAAKRTLVEKMSKGAEWSLNGRKSSDIQADMIREISEINTPNRTSDTHVQTMSEALSSAYDRTTAASKGMIRLLYTDFIDLDKMVHGFEGGDLVLIAARPGQGKTALASNLAYNMAQKKKQIAFFTLEMQNQQIAMRFISMQSQVDYGSQKDGKLKAEEWNSYNDAIEALAEYPIHLCDLPGIKLKEIRRTLRNLEARYGKMDAVIIDYIQLANPDDENSKTREQEVAKVARGMKNIAKEFDTPIFACAQLSRGLESRAEKRPQLADLRESGELEQAADVVMFLYRPDQYEKDSAKQNVVEIIIAKQRNGPVGSVELIYRAPLTKFENATVKYSYPND